MADVVHFKVIDEDPRRLLPEVNGADLDTLVLAFELAHGFGPAGGYGGLVPAYFNYGNLATYLVGQNPNQWPGQNRLWLLACECGEVGCWPLEARVTLTPTLAIWDQFAQPHRRERDYTAFGPWMFDRIQYETSVASAVDALDRVDVQTPSGGHD